MDFSNHTCRSKKGSYMLRVGNGGGGQYPFTDRDISLRENSLLPDCSLRFQG